MNPNLTLPQVVQAFNRLAPKPASKRTVQRWMERNAIRCFGPSQKMRLYDGRAVKAKLVQDFNPIRRAA